MKKKLLILCILTLILSTAFFIVKIHIGNKYTFPGPIGNQGILKYENAADFPLIFLTYGWEFYDAQLLTPNELHRDQPLPTEYLFLGQYGGFRPAGSNNTYFGQGTYRLTIQTESVPRRYMLELPDIYGAYRLWINGQLERDVGFSNSADLPSHSILSFWASGDIELVVEVENHSGLYSGMVYPPAFGSPDAVWLLICLKLMISIVCGACTLLMASLYLWVGLKTSGRGLALSFLLLCLCSSLCLSRAVFQALGLSGPIVYAIQRLGFYGAFFAILLILGKVCDMPQRWRKLVGIFTGGMCLWLTLYPLIGLSGSVPLRLLFSTCTQWYKYGTAACLILSSLWAARRRQVYALHMLIGGLVFADSLLIDRIFPLYEPVLLGWPAEMSVLFLVVLTSFVLVRAAAQTYQEQLKLQEQKRTALFLADARAQQYQVLADHLQSFRQAKHEMLGFLLNLKQLCHQGSFSNVESCLDQQIGLTRVPTRYTSNILVNTILSAFQPQMELLDILFSVDVGDDLTLPLKDLDLSSLLTNLLQNAIDACAALPAGQKRIITFYLHMNRDKLSLQCSNTKINPIRRNGLNYLSSKTEPGHGLGLQLVQKIITSYDGAWDIVYNEDNFSVSITFPSKNQ